MSQFKNLVLNNVEILGYSHQNNFFGESSFNYSAVKNLTIRGFILDLPNDQGVEKIFRDAMDIRILSQDFHHIIINNENYGVGKILSLEFDSGNWVKTTRFDMSVQILTEVPLRDLGSEFTGINISNKKLNLLKEFSENFSLDFDQNSKVLGGEHSIEISYDADNRDIDLIAFAQSLASELLKTIPSSLAEGDYNTRTNFINLHSEEYDLATGRCGFRKSFSYKTEDVEEPYSLNTTHSIEINEEGICTVKESCDIKAEYDVPSLYENALKGLKFQTETSNPFPTRIEPFINTYKNKFNVVSNLNSQHFLKSVGINKFDGTISYSMSWDNDPKKIFEHFLWEYTQSLDRAETGIWEVKESGTITGKTSYAGAQAGWIHTQSGVDARLQSFYDNRAKIKIPNGVLKSVSREVSRSEYEKKIGYEFVKSDDPSILDNHPQGIKKITVEKSDTGVLPIVKDFIIPGGSRRYALVQNAQLRQQGTYIATLNASIGCLPDNQTYSGKTYFDLLTNNRQDYGLNFASATPNARAVYIESINFQSDEIEKTTKYEITYKYS